MSDLPSVTVVVLNHNGIRDIEGCLTSLRGLDYPRDRLELLLVDNASTDGSVELVRTRHPDVRVLGLPTNVGFGGGNNAGARTAKGEYVVFLNNDMWVDPGFLHGFVSALEARPDAVCAAAKILNWDGTAYDFAGAALHFAGFGYQEAFGEPVRADRLTDVRPLLFACGGAMLVDRAIFLDVGGFDEDYFIYYEDSDLGWRLWILGHTVVFAPDAVVRHRHHGTMSAFSEHRKHVLYKRNALSSVIKNYEDANLGRVLSATLAGTVAGVVETLASSGSLDLADYDIRRGGATASRPPVVDRHQAGTLVAVEEVVRSLPRLLEKRSAIQARRRRSDAEVAELFRWPFLHWPDVSLATQFRVVTAFGVDEIFAGLSRRVLVFSPDILPYPGLPTVGSGLRAWGIGRGLEAAGHEVVFSMPEVALEGHDGAVDSEVVELAWTMGTLGEIVQRVRPDVVLVCGWPVLDCLPTERVPAPVVLDQAGPHLLEREHQGYGMRSENEASKLRAFAKADFFVSSGERQHTYFDDWLRRARWTERDRREETGVIPFSLDPHLPERHPNEELTFVYGGIFLPWQDPTVALLELVGELEQRGQGRLRFFGERHAWGGIEAPRFESLLARLEESDRVDVSPFLPYDEILGVYTRADVAVDLMKRNRERELAFTTRTVVYLWCGLPVIYNDYSELSELILEYDAGWTLDPEDVESLRAVLREIFESPETVALKSENARRLVRERLDWERTIAPLDEFIRHPRMRDRPFVPPPAPPPPSLSDKVRWVYRRGGARLVARKAAVVAARSVGLRR